MIETGIIYKGRGVLDAPIDLPTYILSLIIKYEPIDRSGIVKRSFIPRSTIFDHIDKLRLLGCVGAYSASAKTRGRPRVFYMYIPRTIRLLQRVFGYLVRMLRSATRSKLFYPVIEIKNLKSSVTKKVKKAKKRPTPKKSRKRKTKVKRPSSKKKVKPIKRKLLPKEKEVTAPQFEEKPNQIKKKPRKVCEDSAATDPKNEEISESDLNALIDYVAEINRREEEDLIARSEKIRGWKEGVRKRKHAKMKNIRFVEFEPDGKKDRRDATMIAVCRSCYGIFRSPIKTLPKPFNERICPKCL